jgi:hypothetical protein
MNASNSFLERSGTISKLQFVSAQCCVHVQSACVRNLRHDEQKPHRSLVCSFGGRRSTRASLLRHSFRSAPKAKARVQLWILPFSIHGWTRPAAKAAAGKTDGQTDRGRRTIIPKHALRSPRLVDHEGVACSRRRRPVSSLRTPRFSLQLCPRHEQAPPSASRDM